MTPLPAGLGVRQGVGRASRPVRRHYHRFVVEGICILTRTFFPKLGKNQKKFPKIPGISRNFENTVHVVVMETNYYELLGVGKGASQGEIKAAWRRAAKSFHPDTDTGNKAVFMMLEEAYQVLSNPRKRAEYDRSFDRPVYTNNEPQAETKTFSYPSREEIDDHEFHSLWVVVVDFLSAAALVLVGIASAVRNALVTLEAAQRWWPHMWALERIGIAILAAPATLLVVAGIFPLLTSVRVPYRIAIILMLLIIPMFWWPIAVLVGLMALYPLYRMVLFPSPIARLTRALRSTVRL